MAYPSNGVLLSLKKEGDSGTCYNVNEPIPSLLLPRQAHPHLGGPGPLSPSGRLGTLKKPLRSNPGLPQGAAGMEPHTCAQT